MFSMFQQEVPAAGNQNSAQSVGKIFLRLIEYIYSTVEWSQKKKTTFFQTIFHREKDFTEMRLKRQKRLPGIWQIFGRETRRIDSWFRSDDI